MSIRVLVVDDHALVRDALKLYMEVTEDIEWVGEASSGEDALAMTEDLLPSVVLMDIQMTGMGGAAATGEITRRWPEVAVLALTTFSAEHRVFDMLRAGASGYLLKDVSKRRILEAIREVAEGTIFLSPAVAEQLLVDVRSRPADVEQVLKSGRVIPDVPPRERETLRLISKGLSNSEIAKTMYVTERRVKAHISGLCRRFGTRDRVQLLVRATEWGIVEPSLEA